MAKHGVKIAVLAVWVGLMGWWWQESRTWPVPEKVDAAFLPDYYDNFSLQFGDQKFGWSYKSLRRLSDGAYQATQGSTIEIMVGGRSVGVSANVMANFDRVLNLVDFIYTLQSGSVVVSETGQVADGQLTVNVSLGQYAPLVADLWREYGSLLGEYADLLDFSEPKSVSAPNGPVLGAFIPPYLGYLSLNTGRTHALTVFDPVSRRLTTLNVRVEEEAREYDNDAGREIPVFRVRIGQGDGAALVWLDRFGRTLREQSLGLTLTRVDDEVQAQKNVQPLRPPAGLMRLLNNAKMTDLVEKMRINEPPAPGGAEKRHD